MSTPFSPPYATWKTVAFQGNLGAYGHMAAMACCPSAKMLPQTTFEAAFLAAELGEVDGAVIPIDNNSIGRIADIHHLLPDSKLHILGEYFLPVEHRLLLVKGARLADVVEVHSQTPALLQCAQTLRSMGLTAVSATDTAGSAKLVAHWKDPSKAALASTLAGEVYGLEVYDQPMNDHAHNTTRFVVLGREAVVPPLGVPAKTSLILQTKSIPAALYNALGGFANNDINLTKLESYLLGGKFAAAQFYVEAEGHVESEAFRQALSELMAFTDVVRVVGCYGRGA